MGDKTPNVIYTKVVNNKTNKRGDQIFYVSKKGIEFRKIELRLN